MTPARSRILTPTRWIGATTALDEPPCFTCYLAQERIGEARLALTRLDANHIRDLYMGRIETSLGELAVLVEVPPTGEALTRDAREDETAVRALDAVAYRFENEAEASLDAETGFWSVYTDAGGKIATGLTREDAIALAHKQVAA